MRWSASVAGSGGTAGSAGSGMCLIMACALRIAAMPLDLNGTSSIVTGGASGLGESTARLLASHGARVVVVDMNEDRGNKVASDIGGAFVKADVASPDDV